MIVSQLERKAVMRIKTRDESPPVSSTIGVVSDSGLRVREFLRQDLRARGSPFNTKPIVVQSLYPLDGWSNRVHGYVLLVNESSRPIKKNKHLADVLQYSSEPW